MIDCGIDESGRHEKGQLIVSLYAASAGHARKFSTEWKKLIDKSDVPYYHGKEFWQPKSKIYAHLSNGKRKALFKSLVGRIHRHLEFGISVHIDKAEYVSLTTPRFRSQWGNDYTFAVLNCFVFLSKFMENQKRGKEQVNVLIEEGHPNAQQALDHIGRLKRRPTDSPLLISAYGLGGKEDHPMLQASDMLAHGLCQAMARKDFCVWDRLVRTKRPQHWDHKLDAKTINYYTDSIADGWQRRAEIKQMLERESQPIGVDEGK